MLQKQRQYYGLDVAKFISALLVISIHTAPFIQVNETANFILVQIVARLAVPLFFLISGFLFFHKIDPKRGCKDAQNLAHLKTYVLHILRIYIMWSLLYLPILMFSWWKEGFAYTMLLRYLRDFLFTGSYYHLWFLPALCVSVPLVYFFYTKCSRKLMFFIALLLYSIGMLMNVYGDVLQTIPAIAGLYEGYLEIFVTARNGLFFGFMFVALGAILQNIDSTSYKKTWLLYFVVTFAGLIGECFLLQMYGFMHNLTSMYMMLIPCVVCLFGWLLSISMKASHRYARLREMSLYMYVGHIFFVFIFMQVLDLPNLYVYLLSVSCSLVASYGICRVKTKVPILALLG